MRVLEECGFELGEYENKDGDVVLSLAGEGQRSFVEECLLEEILPQREEIIERYSGDYPWVIVFQDVLVRSREAGVPIKCFALEGNNDNSEPGGWACIITEDRVEWLMTREWVNEKVRESMKTP